MSTYKKLCEARDEVLPKITDKAKQEEYMSLLYRMLQIAFYNGDKLPKTFTILNGLRTQSFKKALKDIGFEADVEYLGCGSGKNIYRIKLLN